MRPDGNDFIDSAADDKDFSTIVAVVSAAGLVDTFKSDRPFTVFAPTNAAFAALPEGNVETPLLPGNKDQLGSIPTYHVVPGAVTSDQLIGQSMSVATVQGDTIHFNATDGGVTVDGAAVTTADIIATNGLIHVIDALILPN